MAYHIESNGELSLLSLRDVVLQGVSEFGHGKYTVEPTNPRIIMPGEDKDLYILGSVYSGYDIDRILAYHIKLFDLLDSRFIELLFKGLRFLPDWVVMLGIEAGDGFYDGILHKNLSEEDIFNAKLLGRRLERIEGIKNIAFVHYSVDNREMVPCLEACV